MSFTAYCSGSDRDIFGLTRTCGRSPFFFYLSSHSYRLVLEHEDQSLHGIPNILDLIYFTPLVLTPEFCIKFQSVFLNFS